MARSNLSLRGSTYWWRRKVTVRDTVVPIALSLRTGNLHRARIISEELAVRLEALRMAYGQTGTTILPDTLKKIFSDAMRWQLQRILSDQIGSGVPSEEHRWGNRIWAELWHLFARDWPKPIWTADDDERLTKLGWPVQARSVVSDLWLEYRDETMVSREQLDAYRERFGFDPTSGNEDRVRRVIFGAREEACHRATRELGEGDPDYSGWAAELGDDDTPFAFENAAAATESAARWESRPHADADQSSKVNPGPQSNASSNTGAQSGSAVSAATQSSDNRYPGAKRRLIDAMEAAIAEYEAAKAWSSDTVEQVRTAIRLFDFAAGGTVFIEDIKQDHIRAFSQLCKELPNRWGRTRDEKIGGLTASLARAKEMPPSSLGMSQTTIAKHVTWITQVLSHADDEGSVIGHRPAERLVWKRARRGVGKRKGADQKRARDLRANWTAPEIARLLSAPIWTGSADLDNRLIPGAEIWHDAWYWLPLMLPLYGGRSAEFVALPMSDVHEDAPVPFFRVDFTELRGLKTAQSVRDLPIHPELIRLGILDFFKSMRELGHELAFPELYSQKSKSFASTFYKSIFGPLRSWAFPNGTEWRHEERGAIRDKDVHSFRGVAISLMKGRVMDSVRFDILGHEGPNTTMEVYEDPAELPVKLAALDSLSPLTAHIDAFPLRLRPRDRQRFGARRGRRTHVAQV